jgi:hypothetical protein
MQKKYEEKIIASLAMPVGLGTLSLFIIFAHIE